MSSQDPSLTRAALLRRGGALTALAVSAAASPLVDRAAAAARGATTLRFVGWQGYDGSPDKTFRTLTAWERGEGVKVSSVYVDDNEQMLAKILASRAGSYDLTSPYHGTVPSMIEAGVLEPIRTADLRNWRSIQPIFRDQAYLRAGGKIYAVPFTFSYNVCLRAADAPPLASLRDIVRGDRLAGRYTLLDAPENLTWIARVLGYGNPDPHHLTPDQLKRTQEAARTVVANARALPGSYGDVLELLVGREVDYSLSGTADQIQKAAERGVKLAAFFPREGTQAYVDNLAIPRGSPSYDVALDWIDEMLSPRVQAEVAQVYSGAVVNRAGVPHLPAELRRRYDYAHLADTLRRTPVYPPQPVKKGRYATYADWVRAWGQVK